MKKPAGLLIVGPAYPFRGGIAQHSSQLLRALRSGPLPDTRLISFRRLYPDWLYPGRSQWEPGYAPDFVLEGAEYRLDGLNPLTWRAELRRWSQAPPAVVLMPWWTVFWAPLAMVMLRGARRRGARTCLLIHNLGDHEAAAWKRMLTARVHHLADAFVVHNEVDATALRQRYPRRPLLCRPHPTYTHFPPAPVAPRRRAPVELLFFGMVRPYKGVDVLVKALEQWDGPPVALTLAGEWWAEEPQLRRRLQSLARRMTVEIRDEFIAESDVAGLMCRSDIVVLPYRSATNSGVVGLAYHFGKPVVASAVGALARDVTEGVTGELCPPESASALAEAIRRVVARGPDTYRAAAETAARALSWEAFAASLAPFVMDLAQPDGR